MKKLIFSLLLANIILPAQTIANTIGSKADLRGKSYVCPQGSVNYFSARFWANSGYADSDKKYNWVSKQMIDANLYVGKEISNHTDAEKKAITKKMSNYIVQTENQYKLDSIDYYSEDGHPNILLTLRNKQGKTVKYKPPSWYGAKFWDNNNKEHVDVRLSNINREFFCRGDTLQERVAYVLELDARGEHGDPINIPMLILVLDHFSPLLTPNKTDAPAF
mgnify:CR=1 FL=1|tara:strand:+ start:153 stop:812 length:660 start_codon:yes stop_codon:yes gene_type:complete